MPSARACETALSNTRDNTSVGMSDRPLDSVTNGDWTKPNQNTGSKPAAFFSEARAPGSAAHYNHNDGRELPTDPAA